MIFRMGIQQGEYSLLPVKGHRSERIERLYSFGVAGVKRKGLTVSNGGMVKPYELTEPIIRVLYDCTPLVPP